MNKKYSKGFTLIELMAVIIIISLIALLTFPNIVNQINKTKKSNNKMIEDLLIAQAKKYVSDNEDEFQDDDGYCLSIDTLVDKGYVNEQLVDINNKDNDVIMMIKQDDFSYKIVNKNDCDVSEYQNIVVDSEGKKYERVEYLESTGTQYIDTGFTSNTPEAGYYVKYQNSQDHSGDDSVMGVLSPNRAIGTNNKKVGSSWKQSGVGSDGSAVVDVIASDIIEIWLNFENNNIRKISLNGEVKNSESISTVTSTNNLSFYIFASNLNGSAYGKASGVRVYGAKISLSNEIVRDYIPVLDENDRPCLFDNVGKVCYYNKGTGEFRYMTKNKKIKYIESTGTQYIDTLYIPKMNTRLELDIKFGGDFINSCGTVFSSFNSETSAFHLNFGNGERTTLYPWIDKPYEKGGKIENFNVTNEILQSRNTIVMQSGLITYGTVSRSLSTKTTDNDISMILFGGRNQDGSICKFHYYNMSVYGLKIYEGDVLKRNYIPVLDKNGVPCLYDKVEKKYYYNQGTGEFLYGCD